MMPTKIQSMVNERTMEHSLIKTIRLTLVVHVQHRLEPKHTKALTHDHIAGLE